MKLPAEEVEEAKFSMAPMIDMVFLLLVFFMTASHMHSQQNKQVEIPKAPRGVIPKERPHRWVVNIDKEGKIYSGNDEITLDQLKFLVTARLREVPDTKVYVRADKESKHKEVKRVLAAMTAAEVDDFIFAVYGDGGPEQ
ncbi:MAG: biopolymer transporter ExbD [Kiritimatiellia bacterium]|nr:biopolymer transporter ExbD [Kiritimatiellia bacterium]